MAEKVIIRSSNIDKHGDFVPLEQMKQYVESVNGILKIRYLANHRRDIPPIGYFDNGEIFKENNSYHVMVEPIVFLNRNQAVWNKNFIIEDSGAPLSYVKRNDEEINEIQISLDKNNFNSFEAFNEVGRKLYDIHDKQIKLEPKMRKGLLPDPQVVITLAHYYFILYPLLKPILKRIGDKIADDIADDLYKASKAKAKKLVNSLSDSIKLIREDIIPKNKVLQTIFEIPGDPYIELHIKSDDSNKIIKAITPNKLLKVHQQVKDLQKNIDISEICFVYNIKNKWEFSFLISKTGQVIGTKIAFEKRDKLINRINLSPTKAFSVGLEGVKHGTQKRRES
ncbi:hypothetical protein [Pedobacter sp. L105]|uniref:hypothetical protein n=1 Tax=Pedobacter sp. L105 TaxID=1641871 RepID=UPI00131EB4F0|nr:hypothetical protein [Pedobacter sp. L105]